ncbi:family 20 glycosylhydrolase [Zhouia sp. PK063]|uniref:glycoside hydrolase family 20 protein n=1 Tax=Zhouia sp. PK063 TaxID=3373602 RepID=UPI0037A43FB5
MKASKHLFSAVLFLLVLASCTKQKNEIAFSENDINIIPKPNAIHLNKGAFLFDENTKLVITDEANQPLAEILTSPFDKAAGLQIEVVNKAPQTNCIVFKKDEKLPSENYDVTVTSDMVTITASHYNGFLYGLETILQLLPPQIESQSKVSNVNWAIPDVSIQDGPRFSWRGLMLDVSRHFFGKDYVKEVINELAFHKMNKLHLHLVDDQGWRIEIKKYPKLTTVGAYRVDQEDKPWNDRETPKLGEKATYGGFYTQNDIKEIVAYAKTKGVEVIPEIEMPAHVMSAIAAYPELSCSGDPIMVPSGGVWPITDIYCAGKESTFEFIENVLDEIMPLFPSKYVHVGGDEATKTNWRKCPYCQKRIKEEGLANVEELQSYFMKRIEKYIVAHGKKMIGWDEILEGGLAPEATVMSWRGFNGGWEASKQGHDVVMTPTSYCYFDYYQGPQDSEPSAFNSYTPLHKVYQFNPVIDSMSAAQKKHVLGGQANLWAEQIPTNSHSEYMIYPRIAALSEAVWSKEGDKDWKDFSKRVQEQFKRYDFAGINYAKSAYAVMSHDSAAIANKKIVVKLTTEFPDSKIYYTTNGMNVDANAKQYKDSIVLNSDATIKAAVIKDEKQPYNHVFEKQYSFHKAFGTKITFAKPPHKGYMGSGSYTLVDGLRGSKNFHDGRWQAWLDQNMEAVVDLGEEKEVSTVTLGSMESQGSGINFPKSVVVYVSANGKQYKKVKSIAMPYKKRGERVLKNFELNFDKTKARYIKVLAANPKTNLGGGSFIFFDELSIN